MKGEYPQFITWVVNDCGYDIALYSTSYPHSYIGLTSNRLNVLVLSLLILNSLEFPEFINLHYLNVTADDGAYNKIIKGPKVYRFCIQAFFIIILLMLTQNQTEAI